MDRENELVGRIVSQAGIPGARGCRELERELKAHFEDAAEAAGAEETGIAPHAAICDRFGDPNEIALQFRRLHRADRIAAFALNTFALVIVSIVAVATLIAILQVVAAFSFGSDPALRRLPQQMASIVALVLGYVGTESGYGVFREHRILKLLALHSALCASITAVCLFLPQFDPTTPLMTLAIGASVRTLQVTGVRRLWPLGAVLPLIAVSLFSRKTISAGNEIPLWAAAMIRCAGLTAACHALTWLSRTHQARRRHR